LGIYKWSVTNDNPLTIFIRSSLELPDPHEIINMLNSLNNAEQQIKLWFQKWSRVNGTAISKMASRLRLNGFKLFG
jgi:hypothetical protein